jgi:hypothetical protein
MADFAKGVVEVAVRENPFARVRHTLLTNGASGVVLVAQGQIVGGDGEGQPRVLGAAGPFKFARSQRHGSGELVDTRDGVSKLPTPVALRSNGPPRPVGRASD